VANLYRCRWQIEVFFKQIKQSLQLCDFLGNSANAIRWQVWTGPVALRVDARSVACSVRGIQITDAPSVGFLSVFDL
jgi:Transposase DDE domain